MVGAITSWDIFSHPISTVRCFGWGIFFRAIAPWHGRTFLSLLQETGKFGAAAPKISSILEECIALELRAKRIYEIFAAAFDHQQEAGKFFAGLAVQEQYHVDLLRVCQFTSRRSGWKASLFNPWQDYLPRLEQQMDAVEAAANKVSSLDAALGLVLQIESSEINEVFQAAVAASDSAFVRRLKPFRQAMEAHMNHIAEQIPELSPQMHTACQKLRAKFSIAKN
jgi:hypothetical protein